MLFNGEKMLLNILLVTTTCNGIRVSSSPNLFAEVTEEELSTQKALGLKLSA